MTRRVALAWATEVSSMWLVTAVNTHLHVLTHMPVHTHSQQGEQETEGDVARASDAELRELGSKLEHECRLRAAAGELTTAAAAVPQVGHRSRGLLSTVRSLQSLRGAGDQRLLSSMTAVAGGGGSFAAPGGGLEGKVGHRHLGDRHARSAPPPLGATKKAAAAAPTTATKSRASRRRQDIEAARDDQFFSW